LGLLEEYEEKFYKRVRNCSKCGELRSPNCFSCQEESCENCNPEVVGYYPPEFAFIGENYANQKLKVGFVGQIPFWNEDNIVRWRNGQLADVVPDHQSYDEFLLEYQKTFSSYSIFKNKYGINSISLEINKIVGNGNNENSMHSIAYTNLAKCTNASGSELSGTDQKRAREEITTMFGNCWSHFEQELKILNPQIIVTFDRDFIELLENRIHSRSKDGVSLVWNLGERKRFCIYFYHTALAGVNYKKAKIGFFERIQKVKEFINK